MARKAVVPNATLVQAFTYTQQALPIHKPIVQYIRQSTTKQLKRNKQSYELQDTDLRRNLIAMGWNDNDTSTDTKSGGYIIKIDSDQGKSGTKRRDERTGLDYLYELIENDRAGAVAAFDVSRLYRVLSRAEYGAFCDMVLDKGIPVVTASRIYWPTRVDNDQLSDDFRAAAAFIEEIIKGKLIAAKHRHVQYDTSYGGGSIPMGYVVLGMGDEQADRKYYVVYEPHATLIRWLFKRFRELGGNLPLLARELEQVDFRFPAFDAGIPAHVGLHADTDGTYPLRTRRGLISTLTNRAYIGYYEYGGMLVNREAHEPIVSMGDFMYAYDRLSGVTLDGVEQESSEARPNGRKPRERRYSGKSALLDGVIRSGTYAVYAVDGRYLVRNENKGFKVTELAVSISALDGAFSVAMVSVLAGIGAEQATELADQVKALQQEQVAHVTDYAKSLARIEVEITNAEMAQRVSKDLGDEQGYRQATKELVQLRKDRIAIETKRDSASSEVEDLEDCQNLIECAVQDWNGMDVSKRKRLIRMLHVDADLTELSPHFVRLDVTLFAPTRRAFSMVMHRARGSKQYWTSEEDATLRAMFTSIDEHGDWLVSKDELMQALPTHSWVSICFRGYEKLGIRRTASKADTLTVGDMAVMREYSARTDMAVWLPLYREYTDADEMREAGMNRHGTYMARLNWVASRGQVLYITH